MKSESKKFDFVKFVKDLVKFKAEMNAIKWEVIDLLEENLETAGKEYRRRQIQKAMKLLLEIK